VAKTWTTPIRELGTEASLMGVAQLGVDEHDRMVRSGMISSQIMGLAMMRYVWRIELERR
jgi:hypothetical protein